MKKLFLSFLTLGILLSSCDNNESNESPVEGKSGELKGKISFAEVADLKSYSANLPSTRDAKTTAVPATAWSNIKQVQLFLYDAEGKVAFSYTVKPTDALNEFRWSNIPVGEYTLALVANAKSNTDNVSNSLDGGLTETLFDDYNVRGLKINENIFFGLKKASLPAKHTWSANAKGYEEVSEIFTAYSANKIVIREGEVTDLTNAPLKLMREVSLMRTRFNLTKLKEPQKVHFDMEHAMIAIQRLPSGLGLKKGTFLGGIYETPSDGNKIMIAMSGTTTFMTQNPTYGNIIGLGDGFTLWRDIKVLPNASLSEGKTPSSNASTSRKYYIIVAGTVDAGYKYADGTVAAAKQPVYWYSNINGVFTKNIIREVNITFESAGYPIRPEDPIKDGGLAITIEKPENWNANIESEDINI